jgi:hypothetical protein
MTFVNLVIKKDCKGSEDGIKVKNFVASPEPQPVEEKLASVFVDQGWASTAVVGKPVAKETKVVTPDTKIVKPVDEKKFESVKE